METIAPSAFILAILYVLSRWALSTVEYASANPGKGRPDISWRVTWTIAMLVSLGAAASLHVWILKGHAPHTNVFVFNAVVFGGFLIGFGVTGLCDHRVRLGNRTDSAS